MSIALVTEEAIAKGIRRIVALTGPEALKVCECNVRPLVLCRNDRERWHFWRAGASTQSARAILQLEPYNHENWKEVIDSLGQVFQRMDESSFAG